MVCKKPVLSDKCIEGVYCEKPLILKYHWDILSSPTTVNEFHSFRFYCLFKQCFTFSVSCARFHVSCARMAFDIFCKLLVCLRIVGFSCSLAVKLKYKAMNL